MMDALNSVVSPVGEARLLWGADPAVSPDDDARGWRMDEIVYRYTWAETPLREGIALIQRRRRPHWAMALFSFLVSMPIFLFLIVVMPVSILSEMTSGEFKTLIRGLNVRFSTTILFLVSKRWVQRAIRREIAHLSSRGPLELRLSTGGVFARFDGVELRAPWGVIVGVELVKSGLMLRLSESSFLPLLESAGPAGLTAKAAFTETERWRGARV